MKAAITPPIDHNRHNLSDVLPIDGPYAVYIEPTRACNLKCFYCMHATRGVAGGEFEKTGFKIKNMDEGLYDRVVEELMAFPEHPRKIVMSGLGEPLLNKNLPQMIKKIRSYQYGGRLEVISNGLALTHSMSEALVDAGLSRLCISIQGLTEGKYEEYCATKIDLDRLKEEIKYFYECSRGKCEVYIKIIDAQLEKNEEEVFYQTYGEYCDMIYVEHLLVLEQQMGDHGGRVDKTKNFYREEIKERKICPIHTYYLSINVDGEVFPCPIIGLPDSFSFGNVNMQTLQDIWNGKKRNGFICNHLMGNMKNMEICKTCTTYVCVQDDTENIDAAADVLLEKYKEKMR